MTILKHLRYADLSERNVLDLYLPDTPGPYPVVVAIHGGAWRQGEKERMLEYAENLVDIGIACVTPNHRYSTTDPHPAQQNDILAVFDWIAAHAHEHHLDPRRIGVTGSSSGGHLTALATIKASATQRPYTIRCMMPICGAHDIHHRMKTRPDKMVALTALLGGPEFLTDERIADVSPVEHLHPDVPPCLAVHGELDDVVSPEESERLVAALREQGCEADLLIVPAMGHGRYHPNTDPYEPLGGADVYRAFFSKHLLAT